jgi:purine nucleoside phosphorylase
MNPLQTEPAADAGPHDFLSDESAGAARTANLMLLLATLLPPAALDVLGVLVEERMVATPYGTVGPVALRRLPGGAMLWLQPYSGPATRTDPRATIHAAWQLGVRQVVAWDQVVALNPVLARGQAGVVVDYIDWTRQAATFNGAPPAQAIGEGPVFCPRLSAGLSAVLPFAVEVVYLGVDGPRRETPAEARLYRLWGADVIGHNVTPEAALCQEAGICFAALVTVGESAADRPARPAQGELRAGLAAVLAALPSFVEAGAMDGGCSCRESG